MESFLNITKAKEEQGKEHAKSHGSIHYDIEH
jgi:hypothetical protein